MIHNAEGVWRCESHPDLAKWGVRDPLIAVPPDLGARQPCGPARQVPRVGGELVDLGRSARDVNADMLDVVHGTTPLERAGAEAEDESAKTCRHSRPASQSPLCTALTSVSAAAEGRRLHAGLCDPPLTAESKFL